MKAHLDQIATHLDQYAIRERFSDYLFWIPRTKKKRSRVRHTLKAKDLVKYLEPNCLKGISRIKCELCSLSVPQLIVLYGKMWEKELKEDHIKELEKFLKG